MTDEQYSAIAIDILNYSTAAVAPTKEDMLTTDDAVLRELIKAALHDSIAPWWPNDGVVYGIRMNRAVSAIIAALRGEEIRDE